MAFHFNYPGGALASQLVFGRHLYALQGLPWSTRTTNDCSRSSSGSTVPSQQLLALFTAAANYEQLPHAVGSFSSG